MTDSTKFKLLAAFKAMKQTVNMSTFEDRLILQKKVYLLQQMGLNLGNSYGWYLKGPYSRDVANDGFYLEKIQNRNIDLDVLEKDEKMVIENLQKLVEETQITLNESEAYCLELVASLHFILKYGYPLSKSKEDTINQLSQLKPKFSETNVKVAMTLLEKHTLA